MRRIKGRDTSPELRVRRLLHALGFRFRLHRKDLPGNPDIVLPRHKKVIFVHGCFWHSHDCGRGRRVPKSNVPYWTAKLERNRQRDTRNLEALRSAGWEPHVVWECETRDAALLASKLRHWFLGPASSRAL